MSARVIVIDPAARTIVEEVLLAQRGKDLYRAVKNRIGLTGPNGIQKAAESIMVASSGLALYFDDEGFLKERNAFFGLQGFPKPFPGVGVIAGLDRWGDVCSIDATWPMAEVLRNVAPRVQWFGENEELEAAIQRGNVLRPEASYIDADGKRVVFWSWRPDDPNGAKRRMAWHFRNGQGSPNE